MVTKLQVSEPQEQGPGTDPRKPDIAIGHSRLSARSRRLASGVSRLRLTAHAHHTDENLALAAKIVRLISGSSLV
jgi:hypothetical protein